MLVAPVPPNWTAACVERLRAALRGTAEGWTTGSAGDGCGRGGVEEHALLTKMSKRAAYCYGAAPLVRAAALAERLGHDTLAATYAEKSLGFDVTPVTDASMLALLARVAARRGDRAAVLPLWQKAAATAADSLR